MSLELYDLMGEDHLIYARLESNGEVTITVTNEDDCTVYEETSNIAAWDSLVYFARQILDEDARIQKHRNVVEEEYAH